MNNTVPFVPNSEDDLHCMQSAYLMIVRFFKPDFSIGWNQWSDITGYEDGNATWASASLLWFKENGFNVKHVSLFDYESFAKEGGRYLMSEFGEEVGAWQVEHSNLPLEQERTNSLLLSGIIERREPTQDDIKNLLNEGYLVRCLVNSAKLNNKEGYVGHAIVVSGYGEAGFTIQDPGLPPLKNRKVAYSDFEKVWADPNKEAKELDAIKLPS